MRYFVALFFIVTRASVGLIVCSALLGVGARAETVLKTLPTEFAAEHPFDQGQDYRTATTFSPNADEQALNALLTRVWQRLFEEKTRLNLKQASVAELPRIAAFLLDYDFFFSRLANRRPQGLTQELEQKERETTKRLLEDVQRRFQSAASTRAIADYDVLVTLRLQQSVFAKPAAIMKVLDRHVGVFGPIFRQVPIWTAAIDAERDPLAKDQLLRDYLSAAGAMNEPRAVLHARLLLAQHLSTQARHVDAAAHVSAALPALEDVVQSDFDTGSAFSAGILDSFNLNRSDIQKLLPQAQLERFDRAYALCAARHMNFQTDSLGTAITMVPVLDLKFRDRALFHRALEVGHIHHNGVGNGCDDTQFPAACIAGIGARVTSTIGAFDASLEFQRSRIELLRNAKAPTEEVSIALIELANLELARGFSLQAQATLAEISDADSLEPRFRSQHHFITAALAYLRLDDAVGAELATKAELLQREGQRFDLSPYNTPERDSDGTDLERIRKAINREMNNPNGYTNNPALFDSYLELLELFRKGLAKEKEIQSAAEEILRNYPFVATLVGNVARNRLSTVQAVEAIALADRISSGSSYTANAVQFLTEPKLAAKREIATSVLTELYSSNYSQFGDDPGFFRQMVRFSTDAIRAGYTMAAQVALEKMFEIALPPVAADGDNWQGRLKLEMADTFLTAHSLLAALQIKRSEFNSAQSSLAKADAIAQEKIKQGWQIGSDQLMQSFRRIAPSLQRIAESRIDLLLKEKAPNSEAAALAFRGLQFATLSELSLASHGATRRRVAEALDDPNILARRDQMQQDIRHLEGLLASLTSNFVLRAELEVRQRDLAEATKVIDASFPQAHFFGEIEAVSTADIQGSLNPDEIYIQLHAGRHALYGVAVPPMGVPLFWRSDVAANDLDKQIADLRAGATMTGEIYANTNSYYPKFSVSLANQLYQAIFGKVDERLSQAKRLVIVANGPLQSLPFAMLATALPQKLPVTEHEFRAAKVDWLIRRSALAQMPSARAFIQQRASAPLASAGRRFAGIGNPIFGVEQPKHASIPAFSGVLMRSGLLDPKIFSFLSQLPDTEIELKKIAEGFGPDASTLLLRAEATEKLVKSTDLKGYNIIAFATHGLVAGEAKGTSQPGLALTRPQTQTQEDDGLLTASEILGLKLDAELVILSACNTAASDGRPRADGLSGLAKAFFAAGARGMLVTHINIPTAPAVEISTGLIAARRADPNLDWAQALQLSAISVMDKFGPNHIGHPANWGAYTLIGAARSL